MNNEILHCVQDDTPNVISTKGTLCPRGEIPLNLSTSFEMTAGDNL